MKTKRTVIILVLLATIIMSACSIQQDVPVSQEADTEAIAAQVLAQVEAQQARSRLQG